MIDETIIFIFLPYNMGSIYLLLNHSIKKILSYLKQ